VVTNFYALFQHLVSGTEQYNETCHVSNLGTEIRTKVKM